MDDHYHLARSSPTSATQHSNGRHEPGEDDLTHKLSDIIKANLNVRRCESEGAPVHVVQEFEQLLQV